MRRRLPTIATLLSAAGLATATAATGGSIHDLTTYPVVWTEPGTAAVAARLEVEYGRPVDRPLRLDVYTPNAAPPAGGRAVVLFVSGFGDDPAKPLKGWGIYQSWLRTMAARGYVAVMGETDARDLTGSLSAQLDWLTAHAAELGADMNRIGLWACSGNVPAALDFAMSSAAGRRLRMAALLYGASAPEAIRTDLPVLLVVAGHDAPALIESERKLVARAVEAGAPWTVVEAPTLPHAFDVFDRSDASLATVRQVLAYFDAQLLPPPPSPPESDEARAAREAIAHLFGREWEAAHDYYNKLSDVEDGAGTVDPQVWLNLAWARRGMGSKVGEMLALEQALALRPDDLQLRRRFTRMCGALNDWGRVEEGLRPIEGGDAADADDLGLLGLARLQLDRAEDAIAPLERAIALGAEPATRYNLACALARTGRAAAALGALAAAVEAGYADRESLEGDPDLESIRADPRFEEIVDRVPAAPAEAGDG